jgi:hypothetical protein
MVFKAVVDPDEPPVILRAYQVRDSLKSWLNYMTSPRNLGFSSLRFDFVLGYGAKYVKEYVDTTVGTAPSRGCDHSR